MLIREFINRNDKHSEGFHLAFRVLQCFSSNMRSSFLPSSVVLFLPFPASLLPQTPERNIDI